MLTNIDLSPTEAGIQEILGWGHEKERAVKAEEIVALPEIIVLEQGAENRTCSF